MRKIIIYITAIILLAILSNSVHAQSFGNVGLWDMYSIPAGRVIFGTGDKTTKPDTSAALELRGRKRALYLRGVVSRDSVYSPKPGMIVMDSTDFHIYFRSVSSWIRLDSIGGGSAPDSSIFLTVTDAAATYQPIGSYLTSETDPVSAHLTDSLTKWVTLSQLEDSLDAIPSGGGEDLDGTLAIGNGATNKNIALNRTSGTHGLYLSNSGFDYGHFEISAAGTQLHQYDGDRESIITEDSANFIDNGTGKSISLQPTYIKADTFKVNSGMAVNSLVSGSTINRINTTPNASGTFALISQTVGNGVTDFSPSEDAVYDYVAANIPAASGWSFISKTGSTNNSSSNITLLTPGASKTFTARIVYQGRSASNRVYSGALFVVGTTNGLNTVTITGQSTTSAAVSSFSGAVSANLNTSGPDLILAVSTVTADGAVTWSIKGDYIIQP